MSKKLLIESDREMIELGKKLALNFQVGDLVVLDGASWCTTRNTMKKQNTISKTKTFRHCNQKNKITKIICKSSPKL